MQAVKELEEQVKRIEESLALVKNALKTRSAVAFDVAAHRPGSLADEASRIDTSLGTIATLNRTREALDWNMEQLSK
jgi:hypothetical protein